MADLYLLGLFNNVEPTADAIDRLHKLGVTDDRITVMSGAPYKPEVLGRPHYHGRVGCAASMGAIVGILAAIFLSVGLFLLYPIYQGGQPLVPIPPSLIVFFEVTMLGTMWASFLGLLTLSKLPSFKNEPYDPRITQGFIGIQVVVDEQQGNAVEKALKESMAVEVQRDRPGPAIDRKFRLFWGVVAGGLTVAVVVSLLFFYDVLSLHFPSNMVEQDSFGYEQGPRLAAPADSIPVQGPVLISGQPASEPVPPGPVSLQRGKILFSINCAPCHGEAGEGNGKVAAFLNPKPANLTTGIVQKITDDQIFLILTNGYSIMPSLGENLSPAERWDVVNYIRSLKK